MPILTNQRHEFDPLTSWCVRCGVALKDEFEQSRPCVDGDNIVGLSHYRCMKWMGEITEAVLCRF